ncbi:MAG: SCO family protein [Elusimicrobia bacterium]|nr:SCO family protein [Elusimicrobiota bacterium]
MRRAALAALLLLGASACRRKPSLPSGYPTLNPSRDFALTDQDGRVFRLKDHRGRVFLLFFGYLSCPDVCPATMAKISRATSLLGPRGRQVTTLFVSVDPARDAPRKMKAYLSYFGTPSLGLTGTKAQIDAVVKAYGASYRKVSDGSAAGYAIDHSDLVYLIDGRGEVRRLFHPSDTAETIAAGLKPFLE